MVVMECVVHLLQHGAYQVDLSVLDNGTLWKMKKFVDRCAAVKKRPKKAPNISLADRQRMVQQARMDNMASLSQINASLQSLDAQAAREREAYQSAMPNPVPYGNYSPSDSDSDDNVNMH